MSFGVIINAQDPPKSHQHAMPAKTENSSESAKKTSDSCCREMNSCQGTEHQKTAGEKMHQSKMTNKEASVTYTCPMHPEINSDEPGKCPKCGMDLVKKK